SPIVRYGNMGSWFFLARKQAFSAGCQLIHANVSILTRGDDCVTVGAKSYGPFVLPLDVPGAVLRRNRPALILLACGRVPMADAPVFPISVQCEKLAAIR